MANLGLEIIFWLVLMTYFGARLTQTKKGYKQQYYNNQFFKNIFAIGITEEFNYYYTSLYFLVLIFNQYYLN